MLVGQRLVKTCIWINRIKQLVTKISLYDVTDGNAVPAWAISLMSGIGMLIVGGILYVVMRKIVLSAETGSMNTYQPAMQSEEV